jgi:hypothetical protein
MKIELDVPTWYSREAIYASQVKSTDLVMEGACTDISKQNFDLSPSKSTLDEVKSSIADVLSKETKTWFTTSLTAEQVEKRLAFEFQNLNSDTQDRWIKVTWAPSYLQVLKKGFILLFKIVTITPCNPRIPLTFFESMTPRATTPTEDLREEVRNIVLQPGAGPQDLEQIDDIPLSENLASFEIRDEKAREKQRLRQAKLRAAIARLKVEEMRERYLRKYTDDYLEESSDSEEETSSQESELSEPVHKK